MRATTTSESRRVPLRGRWRWPRVPGSSAPARVGVQRSPAADVRAFTLRTGQRCMRSRDRADHVRQVPRRRHGRIEPPPDANPPSRATIGRGRRQNPSDRTSAQASRPSSAPSSSHWTSHRARDVAVVARRTAPQGRPMTTATHGHESINHYRSHLHGARHTHRTDTRRRHTPPSIGIPPHSTATATCSGSGTSTT